MASQSNANSRGSAAKGGSKRRVTPAAQSSRKASKASRSSGPGTSTVRRERTPQITFSKDGCRVVHREYLQEIVGSVAYANAASLPVNPGMASTFPWLAAIASRYESYSFNSLKFEFSRETTEFLTAGKVMLTVDYDASDPAPLNKVDFMAQDEAVSAIPSTSFTHVSKKENLHRMKSHYVRNGALSADQDIKLYDVGNLFVATQGQPNTDTQGELYVDYDVSFMTPQLAASFPCGKLVGTGSVSLTAPFGTAAVLTGPIPVDYVSGTTIRANQNCQLLITLVTTGTAITGNSFSAPNVTVTSIHTIANGAATAYAEQFTVVMSRGDLFTLTPAAATITACVMRFASYTAALV